MSSVRMCDNPDCGEIFSEAEQGWSVSQQTKVIEDEDGRRNTINMTVDLCPDCSPDTRAVARQLSARRRQNRIARLELETGDPIQAQLDAEEKKHA